jgi:uncharacterized protein YqjF (DUF2071 family)
MAGAAPEEDVARAAVHQGWRHVSMLHWRYPPEVVGALLPDGLEVDVVDGSAWVSLTPFLVTGFRVTGLPPVPWLSSFPETNLRTYVRGADGSDGLWFLSLDVASVATTIGARLGYGVPYHWASMSVEEEGDDVFAYRGDRRSSDGTSYDVAVRRGSRILSLSPLDELLTGRWRAFSQHAGRLWEVPVRHEPWPLRTGTLVRCKETLLDAGGLPAPAGPPLVHFADAVDAHLGFPRHAGERTNTDA